MALQAFANATMHPSDTPTIRWQASHVYLRVFIPLLLVISVVGIFRYQHMLHAEVAAANERSKAEATRIGEALLEALQRIPAEQKEQTQQLLQDSTVYFAPQLKSVHWQMPGQTALVAQRPPVASQAPVWFTRWTDLRSTELELKQELPDGHVATLTVSLQASVFSDEIWQHLRQQSRFSLFNILFVIALLGLLVSRHVRLVGRCLRALRQLQRGQSQVRMMVTGMPSERAVAGQFNLAADKLQSQWQELQNALQRQAEQLELARLLAISTPHPVTLRKDDGTCIDVQKEWNRLFGQDLAALEGVAAQDVALPAQHAGAVTPDSDTQPTDDLTAPMSDTIAHLVTASDWHRAQEASRRASKAGTSVSVVPGGDGVITTDLHGHIETINEAAQFMTGFKTHQAMGRPLEEVFRLAQSPVPTNPSEEQAGSGNAAAHPVLVHRSGERYAISYTASPIRKSNGVAVGCVLVFHDVSESSHFRHTISWQAHHDALTGLHNRAALAEHLTHGIFNAQRHQTLLAVCMLDLDHFEDINTTHGTATGDRVLREVALRLRTMTGPHDAVARMGGDEFVVMLGQQTDIAAIHAQAQDLLAQLAQPYAVDELQLNITASIGVALYPHVDATPTALLRHADQAMCVAKRAGRQQVHFFDPASDAATPTSHTQQTRIAQALRTGEMRLHYQPQVRLDTGDVCSVEALLRWQHPEQGMLGPEQILPLIEDADLAAELGEWVLQEALAQMQQWHAIGLGWTVGVNIATVHLLRSNFAARLHELLNLFATVPPHLLQLEIKQSAGQHDPQAVHDVMKDCRDRLGIRWAVDDIGIGHAPLAWVTQLPIDTLKIDRSIVKAVPHSPEDAAIVSTMVTLAQSLQWTLVAEGVESAPHCQALRQLGCSVAQGYAIAHPMPGRELADWARSYQRSLSAEPISR